MLEEKKITISGATSLQIGGIEKEQPKASPRMSRSLTKAIANDGGELSLWRELPLEEKKVWIEGTIYDNEDIEQGFSMMIADRNGKPVSLNYMEEKIVRYLEEYVSERLYDETIGNYVEIVSKDRRQFDRTLAPQISLNIFDMTNRIEGRTGREQLEAVSKGLNSLSEKWQFIDMANDKGEIYRFSVRYIALTAKVEKLPSEVRSSAGRKAGTNSKQGEAKIIVEAKGVLPPIFYNRLINDFCPQKPEVFEYLRIYGRKEVGRKLLDILETHFKQVITRVNIAEETIKNSKSNKRLSEQELQEKIVASHEKNRGEPFTYARINNKLEKPFPKRKKYDFVEALKRAVEGLIDYGIITGAEFRENDVLFKYNLNFATFEEKETLLTMGEDSTELLGEQE